MVTEGDPAALRRAWVEAANAFVDDLQADVTCPVNGDAKLVARYIPGGPGVAAGELVITCPGCGASTAVRVAGPPGS